MEDKTLIKVKAIKKAMEIFELEEAGAVYCPECKSPLIVEDHYELGALWVKCDNLCTEFRDSRYIERGPLRKDGKLRQVMDGSGDD